MSRDTGRAAVAAHIDPNEPARAMPRLPQMRGAQEASGGKTVRLTANLPLDAAADLDETVKATGFNKLTTLSRAIRVFALLVRTDAQGGEVILKEADGTRSRLILR